jgi:putative addiction module component (TIGR02574 family)
MIRIQLSELHKLSVKDKIKVVQTLWDDIAKEQSIVELPATHKEILDQRIKKIGTGNATFKPWAEVQSKYGNL